MEPFYTGIGFGATLLGGGLGLAAIIAAIALFAKWSN